MLECFDLKCQTTNAIFSFFIFFFSVYQWRMHSNERLEDDLRRFQLIRQIQMRVSLCAASVVAE